MPTEGYDLFYEQEKLEEKHCNVCGAKCDVERDITIKVNSMVTGIMAEMRGKHHDKFTCPNSGKEWHLKTKSLVMEKDQLASKYLSRIVEKEIEEVLQKNLNGGDPLE